MTSRPILPQLSGVSASVSAMRQEAEASTAKSVGYYGALNTDLLDMLPGEAIRFLDVGCAEGRLGKEVKKRAKRMRWYDHPELTPPKPKPRPTKGDIEDARDRQAARAKELLSRDRWGVDERGFRTPKAAKKRKTKGRVVP